MKQQKVVVDFDENGDPKIEAFGFEGKSCLEATADLEKAFGGKVTNEQKKPEYAKREQGHVKHRNG